MFSHIRIFATISFAFVLVAAVLFGWYYKHVAGDNVVDMVKTNSASVAESYVNSVWNQHQNTLRRLSSISVDRWKLYREFQAFRQDTIKFFDQMNVNEARIYLPGGTMILSSSPSYVRESEHVDVARNTTFAAATKGVIGVNVLENKEYTLPNGDTTMGTLISSYLPIYKQGYVRIIADAKDDHIAAVLRLDLEVTKQWTKLTNFQYVATFGIISLFMLLITFLIFYSRRAESIITRQHEVNLKLTAAASAAQNENRDKSMFLANISHELRTPLNAVIGFSEIMQTEMDANYKKEHREYIRDINSSGKHLLSLINDILEFSKAEAGKLEVDIGEVDASKMIKNSIRLMIPRAEEAQVTILEELPERSFIMETDAKKLKQVLLNLLSNAVKFTPPSGKVKVTVRQDLVRKHVVITVRDTGIGIAPKDISKVMTPFGQVESHLSRRYEGTGLGLPLSKKLVELLGGTFVIKSEQGEGTAVTLDLPLKISRNNEED